MKATQLRANLYRVLDRVVTTGVPVEVDLRGQRLEIRAKSMPDKLGRLVRRPSDLYAGNPTEPGFDEEAWLAKWDRRLGRMR